MDKKRRKDISGIIAVIIVIVILLIGALFMLVSMFQTKTVTVNKPEVSVSLSSDSPVYYSAKMSFEGNVDKLNKISDEEYRELVIEAFTEIGEEKLASADGTDLIKEKVKEKITERLKTDDSSDFEISHVFIDKLVKSDSAPQDNVSKRTSKDVADMFKKK